MPEAFAKVMHNETVRAYRRELEYAPRGLKRARLLTLIARLKRVAEERGWPAPED